MATFAAVINVAGSYTVTLNTNITVESLLLNSTNATVNQTTGIFSATAGLTLSAGAFQMSGGTISNTTVNVTGGTLLIAANGGNLLSGVTVNGDLNLNTTSAQTKIAGGTTFTQAHLAANASSLGFAPGQMLAGTILFEGAVGGTRFVEMNGTAGTFTIGATGVIRTNAGLTGDGSIGGSQNFGGAMTLVNQGLISSQVSGRTITISAASLTNTGTGTLEAKSGGILTIAPTATWTNAGTISVNAATVNLGGTFDATGGIGAFSNTGGTVNITGTLLNTAHTLTLDSTTGSWTLNGGTISGGTLGFAGGQSLLIAATAGNLLTGVTVNGDLNLNTTSAQTKIAGGTTFTQAHLAANASSLGFAPGQMLAGTILFEGAVGGTRFVEMNGTAGTFTIGATGVIRTNAGLTGDGSIGGSQNFGGAMTLVNQGLISSQVSGRTITISAASLTNTGTVEATNGGTVSVPAGYTQNAGITRVAGGGTISAVNGPIVIAAGRIEGSGTVNAKVANSGIISPGLSAGTLAIADDLSLTGTSEIQIEIGGLAQGTQFDLLTEAGTLALNLNGTLRVSLINAFTPGAANSFTVITSNQGITGAFANVVSGRIATAGGEGTFQVVVSGNSVVLNNFAVPEPSSALLLAAGAGMLALNRKRKLGVKLD